MGIDSRIEWTDATWNPVVGCSKVSPGCDNCYAISMARRIEATGNEAYSGTTTADDWTGLVKCLPERLDQPLRWRKPRRIFVNSMSDLFHPYVPSEFIRRVFDVFDQAPQHTFQVLTKRPQRMAEIVDYIRPAWYRLTPSNVWLGTSIESDIYTFRANHLRATPTRGLRFLSLEPLLGPLPSLNLSNIDWVIVGGESGPQHRPVDPDWVRDLRDRCVDASVPFFFKQWGGRTPKAGGRQLDGRTWDEYPAMQPGVWG
jgi:protein gp37